VPGTLCPRLSFGESSLALLRLDGLLLGRTRTLLALVQTGDGSAALDGLGLDLGALAHRVVLRRLHELARVLRHGALRAVLAGGQTGVVIVALALRLTALAVADATELADAVAALLVVLLATDFEFDLVAFHLRPAFREALQLLFVAVVVGPRIERFFRENQITD
jgi:hypothetical protein